MKLFLFLFFGAGLYASEVIQTLNFDEALKEIVNRNIELGIQKSALEEIQSRNLPSHYFYLPTLSATASQSYTKEGNTPTQGLRSAGLRADLNLFKFGGDLSRADAASSEEKAQEYYLENTYLQAEQKGVLALIQAIQTEMTVRTYNKITEMRKDAVKIATARYEKGLVASQEAQKFLVDSDNAEAQLKDAEGNLVLAKADLMELLGHSQIEYEWPWKNTFFKGDLNFNSIDGSLENRPDYLRALHQEEQSNALSSQAWSGIFPSLDVSLTYGYFQSFQPSPQTSGLQWMGMATLTLPLFDKLSNIGTYKAARARRTQSQIQLENIRRKAQAEFQSSRRALEISLQSAKLREVTLGTSRKLYESNLQRFRRAIVNANELMNDQERLFQSELLAIKGWADAHTRLVQLCHTYGKRLAFCLNSF